MLLRNASLWTKINLVVAVVLTAVFAAASWLDYRQQQRMVEQESVAKARLVAASAIRAREYISDQLLSGKVQLSQERYGLIPVVASNRIGAATGRDVGYQVRQVSNRYRNPANAPDPFESETLKKFAADPALREFYAVSQSEGERVFRYLQPFRAEESCLECHGDPATAPAFLRAIYPVERDPAYGYRLGEIVGAASVTIPLHQLDRQVAANLRFDLLHTGAIFLALIAFLGLLLRRTVTRPLHELGEALARVERTGNFATRLPARGSDEIGRLSDGFNRMMGELERNVGQLEESEQRFRLLTDTAHDSIVSFLANGQIILFNRRAEELFGYSRADALGLRVEVLIHPDCSELVGRTVEELLRSEEAQLLRHNRAVLGRSRDGRALPLELALSVAESDGHRFYTAMLRERG